ncbi:MAG: ATP-dependent RecD-like DNA helicase [Clostridiales bacterium]|jgi:exodeoxyribonuclease V alpha subunit|nr:ATP-dependent RecD-like DNA helicase [Clostridiales bacterium]
MDAENGNEKQILTGVVEDVVYYNDENCYAVCYIQTESDYVAVVGYLPYISEGESVAVTGVWTNHAEYGTQFKAEYYEKHLPKEKADILKYLSSGIIKGIRQVTAEKIVERFGGDALNVIADSPEKLACIGGISRNKAIEIGKSYAQQLGVRDVVIFLQKFGVPPSLAVKVYKHYGSASVDVIKSNPYMLSREVYGIGFKTADKIAMSMGVEPNAPPRIEAAVSYVLWEGAMNGHTFLPRGTLTESTCRLIGADAGECDAAITSMLFSNQLINELLPACEAIYQPALHNAELQSAARLAKIASVSFVQTDLETERIIADIEREQRITLAGRQREAVLASLKNGAMVITGGPGTGKTTIINAIIRVMEHLGKRIMLAAPTGRAAKRMSELCGTEAKTLHRLLEVGFAEESGSMTFSRNDENPLDCDVLIVDEMSMVDTLLLYAVLKAVKSGTRLIMVGDSDQLPSVGAGDVLRDVIASGSLPVIQLTEIFSQAKESMIVVNAHKINNGEYPVMNQRGSDFFMLYRENGQDLVGTIVDLCGARLPNTYGYDPITQIQVITPTRKGVAGVSALNERLQKALNPPGKAKKEKQFKTVTFREGDKVMQIKNNYELEWKRVSDGERGVGVFNGDVGQIARIDTRDETMAVLFDDREAVYDFARLDEIDLAYAVTVHKSQGSEFEAVVMPMYPSAPMLQNRNLLYTAVTRAKKLVVLAGRESVVRAMVDNVSEQKRFSGLRDKLRSLL